MHVRSTRRRGLGVASLLAAIASVVVLVAVGPTPASARTRGDEATPVDTTPPVDTTCHVAEGNARFVRFVFVKILERCPEPAALEYYTKRLDAGLTRFNFAETVDMSHENLVDHNIVGIYQGVLGRPPTSAEIAAGINYFRANHEDGTLLARLFSSEEAYGKLAPTTKMAKDAEWLKQAFTNIVDRPPTSAEQSRWMAYFGPSGSTVARRFYLASQLERSEENATSWIFGVYGAGLGRGAQGSEIGFWTNWLMGRGKWQTFRMWTNVLSSPEAYRLAQTEPPIDTSEH